jgi:hypothetical protein
MKNKIYMPPIFLVTIKNTSSLIVSTTHDIKNKKRPLITQLTFIRMSKDTMIKNVFAG